MLSRNSYRLFVFLAVFQSSFTQRRIKDGKDVSGQQRYVVYLLRAATAVHLYEGWTCGGAIVSEEFVVTSAACVEDVKHMYVIAGYQTYVPYEEIEDDKCVSQRKKKVIQTCVPMDYRFEFNKTELWAKLDIALVRVESPFNFSDTTYKGLCSYTPRPIEYNTEGDFPEIGVDVIVLGWGHTKEFRKETDRVDLNQKNLHYAPTKIMNIQLCAKQYDGNSRLTSFITTSMLCTLDRGKLDDQGQLIFKTRSGCNITDKTLRAGDCPNDNLEASLVPEEILDYPVYEDSQGEEDFFVNGTSKIGDDAQLYTDITRRSRKHARRIGNITRRHGKKTRRQRKNAKNDNRTRRQEFLDIIEGEFETLNDAEVFSFPDLNDTERNYPGICQNDHGGPLVGWRGGGEILVGIATLYRLNERRQCRGPYLYTKTACNVKFLDCVLKQTINISSQEYKTRRINCEDPAELGFKIVRRSISWVGHKDGPADNERIEVRRQVPISRYQPGLRQVNKQLKQRKFNV